MIINGKEIAQSIKDKIKAQLSIHEKDTELAPPTLVVIMVGNHPASEIYVRNKERACEEVGIRCVTYRLPESICQDELLSIIKTLNEAYSVHGLFVQFPLPAHISKEAVQSSIHPSKDVDGFGPQSVLGTLSNGLCQTGAYFNACTPKGIMYLLKDLNVPKGSHAVIVGRSDIVGKPLSHLLLHEDYTITVCHSKTKDLKRHTLSADVLISAIGVPRFIKADMVKPGAVVIDVGINRDEFNVLCGDVDYEPVSKVAAHVTPVPGGVGPMTVACLMENVFYAYKRWLSKQ